MLKTLIACCSVLLTLAPLSVFAATITVEEPDWGGFVSESRANPVGLQGTLGFDPALGTLTSLSIRTIGNGSADYTLDVPEAGTYQGPLRVSSSLLDGSGTPIAESAASTVGTIRGISPGPGALTVTDGNSWISILEITSGLDLFLGADLYDLSVSFHGTLSGPGLPPGPYVADAYEGAMRVQRVVYTYTPIPEPSVGLLFMFGVALLSAGHRRVE